ncbi:glycosyltransferase family 4 protein [Arthrospira platensis]|uniref:glycosyltransferase family 4 protein n=1 Tax=Limnospira TaxID=2596745 RepID=UPI0001C392AE|nr:glycosyltransferase family 4 protein [Arthrospira platensis]AMW30452.1 glycosyl transferase group 1 [Arthrospira platensis YZ]MBD2710814.1 glycosyltransferase family 4 protein [Arthrospira platensis FACHB-835]MDT9183232.1 glycosyltransferase family 4 protein [Limnospira sp. PMC 289.06]MDT9295315.1 glycosyltransferase family 4 protein [Arthrospira platensis PCC 7345]MDT9311068.1 glycosyltransferase family 4 protein [Limnospira sp. Paracas R14]QQW28399.1 glycosyltransferase family 4 protein 
MKVQPHDLKKLKISIISPEMSGAGVVRSFLIAQALKMLNYQVEILGFLVEGKNIYVTPAFDVSIFSVAVDDNYQNFISASPKILEKVDGDIIYAVKPRSSSFGISLIKKVMSRRPLVLDIDDWELSWQGGDDWKYSPNPKQLAKDILKKDGVLRNPDYRFYLKLMEKLVSYSDAVTVNTKFIQNRFGGVYLPNGKDTTLFDPSKYNPEMSRSRYHLSEYKILMFPGAPRPYKGVEDVLMALDLIDQSDFKLVIVGGSPYDNYDDILMETWGRWIIKLPNFPAEKMPEIVAAAHVIVVPQRDHPATRAQFPLKLTDGMSMAKPVLASRVGDIPEILGDTGYLVEPNSPEQIADTLQLIFQDLHVANDRGLQARKRCVELYSLEAMANVLSNVIYQVM